MTSKRIRRGFTLVELLSVMAIIGILSTAMIAALSQAQESAKKMRTRQLIAKIHQQLMPRWEAFQTRRLPINIPTSASSFPQTNPQNPYLSSNNNGNAAAIQFGRAVAWFRLWALRELIRMEMPDRYNDLLFTPQSLINQITVNGQVQNQAVTSGLRQAYMQKIASLLNVQVGAVQSLITAKLRATNESAELLWLVVTVGTTDQELYSMSFNVSDWGDTDNDGVPEFLDAWGNPIAFLRWAPGYQSDLQPIFSIALSSPGAKALPSGLPTDPTTPGNILTHFPVEINQQLQQMRYVSTFNYMNNHDAFDPLEVDPGPLTRNVPERGFNLIPLIYSPGPNGNLNDILNPTGADPGNPTGGYGLFTNSQQAQSTNDSDPYYYATAPANSNMQVNGSNSSGRQQRGTITDPSAYDNIHNHLIGQR
jgi:prepilin-type N-terminal cleavage/methylation domain-containing protein